MKKYLKPTIEVIDLFFNCDVITTSANDNDYEDKNWEQGV